MDITLVAVSAIGGLTVVVMVFLQMIETIIKQNKEIVRLKAQLKGVFAENHALENKARNLNDYNGECA